MTKKSIHSAEEMVQTIRPDRKTGIKIPKTLYRGMCYQVIHEIQNTDDLSTAELIEKINGRLHGQPNIEFVTLHIKLDLECRGYIRMVPSPVFPKRAVLRITRKGIWFARGFDSTP